MNGLRGTAVIKGCIEVIYSATFSNGGNCCSGSVKAFVEKLNKPLATLQAGQFFGELALMLEIPRTATVQALEDTILFVINNKGFKKILQEHPDLAAG